MKTAKRLLHTRYRVDDLERTVKFYKEVLGLQETRRHKSSRGSELVFMKAPESEETVELYVRLEGTSTAQPVRALKGFQRVKLAAGQTQRVTFHLGPDAFALWDDQNKYVVEPARAKIWISPDSARGSEATIAITK